MQPSSYKPLSLVMAVALFAISTSVPAIATGAKPKKPGSSGNTGTAVDQPAGTSNPSATDQPDRKPGPAWKTIGGKVKHIKGNTYTVEDYEGNQVQLYVGQETKHLHGNKKVGDPVRAEITRGGYVNSIQ